jgi:hypothetical protein
VDPITGGNGKETILKSAVGYNKDTCACVGIGKSLNKT